MKEILVIECKLNLFTKIKIWNINYIIYDREKIKSITAEFKSKISMTMEENSKQYLNYKRVSLRLKKETGLNK